MIQAGVSDDRWTGLKKTFAEKVKAPRGTLASLPSVEGISVSTSVGGSLAFSVGDLGMRAKKFHIWKPATALNRPTPGPNSPGQTTRLLKSGATMGRIKCR